MTPTDMAHLRRGENISQYNNMKYFKKKKISLYQTNYYMVENILIMLVRMKFFFVRFIV